MPDALSWQWLLAMSMWNPLPKHGSPSAKGCDSYCPKPLPMVAPCKVCQCDDYAAKPLVTPVRECRGTPACQDKKPFPVLRANNFSGTVEHDKCAGMDFFGLRPRP
jgi:hypothetical protein